MGEYDFIQSVDSGSISSSMLGATILWWTGIVKSGRKLYNEPIILGP
jgi:hypothetical protein